MTAAWKHADLIAVGGIGRTARLNQAGPSTSQTLTCIKGGKWMQERDHRELEQPAALTFGEVPIRPARSH